MVIISLPFEQKFTAFALTHFINILTSRKLVLYFWRLIMKYTCHICNCIFSAYKFKKHIINDHNTTEKEYYDTYLKTTNNICLHCGKPTQFRNMYKGYKKYCCTSCSAYAGNTIEAREKAKQTCLKHLGVLYPTQAKDTIKKREDTCLNKYGYLSINQVPEIKKKQHTPDQVEKMLKTFKETCLSKYGVENISSLPEVKEKRKNTLLKHYNVEYTFQSHEIRIKSKARYISPDGKQYDSKWEYLYEQYLIKNNIDHIYSPDIKFEYIFEDKIKYYFPDFVVNINGEMRIVEIKGDHLFKEMQVENTQANAKYKCMLENNVIILQKQDLIDLGINIKYKK